jgi:hypothetical protein
MTSRLGAFAPDNSLMSQADTDRAEADRRLHEQERKLAVRVVAAAAYDATDCRLLLDILGLREAAANATGRSTAA